MDEFGQQGMGGGGLAMGAGTGSGQQSGESEPEPELELDDGAEAPWNQARPGAPAPGGVPPQRETNEGAARSEAEPALELDDRVPDARLLAAEAARASGGPVAAPAPHRVSLICGACGAKQYVQTRSVDDIPDPGLAGGPFRRESRATSVGMMYGWLAIFMAALLLLFSWVLGPLLLVFGWIGLGLMLATVILGIRAMANLDLELKWRPFMAGAGAGLALTTLLWAMG